MISQRTQELTTRFYQWEQLGRGWLLFDYFVQLEPPFYPFFFHGLPVPLKSVDDGLHPSFLDRFKNLLKKEREETQPEEFSIEAFENEEDELNLNTIRIACPTGYRIGVEEMDKLLLMLSYSRNPISFEIVSTSESIHLQFVCREEDSIFLLSQLKAYFPQVVTTFSTAVEELFSDDLKTFIFDFGLAEEFMRPITSSRNFDLDPYTGVFGILEYLQGKEKIILQILFKGTSNSWSESILRSVMDDAGGGFFMDAPDMLPLAKEKISSPLFAATIKLITQSETDQRAEIRAQSVSNAITQMSKTASNKVIPLSVENYESTDRVGDVTFRQSHRLGMLLNSRELATFVHFPSPSIASNKLVRDVKKTKSAPKISEGHKLILGSNYHQGTEKIVTLDSDRRLKHTHIIGATGTGKSTFLINLISQDIQNRNGVAVLDPHGDLIENILPLIPAHRITDVIIIDPSDSEYPVGFNILKAHSDIEKEILSSDLVAAFKRLSTSWGDQMNSVFANAILAFLESSEEGTLMDLRRFLLERPFRDNFLKTVADSQVIYYWQKEFPILKSTSIGPILTRLDTFLRPKLIRNMVSQKKSIDFESVLDEGKILLVKLSQGLIGNENSYLLGTFIVSKIQQAAMARQAKAKETRNDFFLYIDEFQNFITPSMSAILSGARKYHLGLILAHQDMQQLLKYDSELASSVIANAGTRVCFRLGDTDSKKFESGFSFFDAKDLQSLNLGEAIARMDRPDYDFNLSVSPTITSNKISYTDQIISRSREKHGTEKRIVESAFQSHIQPQEDTIRKESIKSHVEEIKASYQKTEKPLQPLTEEKLIETKDRLIEKKEQSEHRYLQMLIKRMAESRAFKATIEQPTPDGKGRVDILLERNNKTIACEITITTSDTWEVHNIKKCLAAGYDSVAVCAKEKSYLEKIRKKCEMEISEADQKKILYFEPEGLFLYLDQQIATEASSEKRVKGYRVKVNYSPTSEEEAKQKKDSILKAVTESAKSKK